MTTTNDLFSPLQLVKRALSAAGAAHRKPLPEVFSHARIVKGDRVTELQTTIATLDAGELRCVAIEGPKVAIVTTFFWPEADRAAAVYAMELVAFAGRPVVAVIDVIALTTADRGAARQLMTGRRRLGLPNANADDPPDWYQACRSGDDLFLRPTSMETLSVIGDLAISSLTATVESARKAPRLAAEMAIAHAAALRDYKHHHRDNSPGLTFLNRSFGEDWTRQFLDEHVFA